MTDEHREKLRKRFQDDTKNHELTILLDTPTHKHLRLKAPTSHNYYYELIATPGFLAIRGDCGTWCFERVTNMFDFFRITEPYLATNKNDYLYINPGYWAEKLVAVDKQGSYAEFKHEVFEKTVMDHFAAHKESLRSKHMTEKEAAEQEIKLEEAREALEAIIDDVENGQDAYQALQDLESSKGEDTHGFYISDSWEYRFTDFRDGYIWCLFAIVSGIRRYDAAKLAEKESENK